MEESSPQQWEQELFSHELVPILKNIQRQTLPPINSRTLDPHLNRLCEVLLSVETLSRTLVVYVTNGLRNLATELSEMEDHGDPIATPSDTPSARAPPRIHDTTITLLDEIILRLAHFSLHATYTSSGFSIWLSFFSFQLSSPRSSHVSSTVALPTLKTLRALIPVSEEEIHIFLHPSTWYRPRHVLPSDSAYSTSGIDPSVAPQEKERIRSEFAKAKLLIDQDMRNSNFPRILFYVVNSTLPLLFHPEPPVISSAIAFLSALYVLSLPYPNVLLNILPHTLSSILFAIDPPSPPPGGRVKVLIDLLALMGAIIESFLGDATCSEALKEERSAESLASLSLIDPPLEPSPPMDIPLSNLIHRTVQWLAEIGGRVDVLLKYVLRTTASHNDPRVRLALVTMCARTVARSASTLRPTLPRLVDAILLATEDPDPHVRSIAWASVTADIRPRPEFLHVREGLRARLSHAIASLPAAILAASASRISQSHEVTGGVEEVARQISAYASFLGQGLPAVRMAIASGWTDSLPTLPSALALGPYQEEASPLLPIQASSEGSSSIVQIEEMDGDEGSTTRTPPTTPSLDLSTAPSNPQGSLPARVARFRHMSPKVATLVGRALGRCGWAADPDTLLSPLIASLREPQVADSGLQGGCIWAALQIIRGSLEGSEEEDISLDSDEADADIVLDDFIHAPSIPSPSPPLHEQEALAAARALIHECIHLPNLEAPTSTAAIADLARHLNATGAPPLPNALTTHPAQNALVTAVVLSVLGDLFGLLHACPDDLLDDLPDLTYPLLVGLGDTGSWEVQTSASHALQALSTATGYPSPRALLLENIDYVLDSISRRLLRFSQDPLVTTVLSSVLHVAGLESAPYLGDLLEDLLDALSRYRDSPYLRGRLIRLLQTIVESVISPSIRVEREEGVLKTVTPDPKTTPKKSWVQLLLSRINEGRSVGGDDSTASHTSPITPILADENEDDGKFLKELRDTEEIKPTAGMDEIAKYFTERSWKDQEETAEDDDGDDDKKGGPPSAEIPVRPLYLAEEYAVKVLDALRHHVSADDPTVRAICLRTITLTLLALPRPSMEATEPTVLAETIILVASTILPRLRAQEETWVRVCGYEALVALLPLHIGEINGLWNKSVWPEAKRTLGRLSGGNTSQGGKFGHLQGTNKELVISILHVVERAVKEIKLGGIDMYEVGEVVRGWLDARWDERVGQAARSTFTALSQKYGDVAWVLLHGCGGRRGRWSIERGVRTDLPDVSLPEDMRVASFFEPADFVDEMLKQLSSPLETPWRR